MIIPALKRVRCEHTEINTETLKDTLEPCNCSVCGCRLGWADTDYVADTLVLFCDECAAEPEQQKDHGEEE